MLEMTKGHTVSCLTTVSRGYLKKECKKQMKYGLTSLSALQQQEA